MLQNQRFSTAVPSVLFLTMMVFFVVLPRYLVSPLLLRMADGFGLDYGSASMFFIFTALGFVAGLLVSGYVARLLTHRWTIVVAVGTTGVFLILLSLAQTLTQVQLMLFLSAFAGGLYPGSGIASVAALVPDHHRGKALAVHESGPNFGFIMAPLLSAAIAPFAGWRGVFMVTGFGAVVAATLFAKHGNGVPDTGLSPDFRGIRLFIRNRSFWVVTVLFSIAVTAAIGVYSVLPTFLMIDHGYSEQLVNTVVGVSRVTGFAAIFAAGILVDRFGFAAVVGTIFTLTGIVTILLGVLSGRHLLIAVFLQPLIVQAFFPVAVDGLTRVVPPEAQNLSIAFAVPITTMIGTGIVPRVMTTVGAAGHFGTGFVVLGACMIASLALLPLLATGPLARVKRVSRVGLV
jgi:MFS transporter, NNP family, nitrate/nitrite transporter